jgi:hypothetical protein
MSRSTALVAGHKFKVLRGMLVVDGSSVGFRSIGTNTAGAGTAHLDRMEFWNGRGGAAGLHIGFVVPPKSASHNQGWHRG